MRDGRASSSTWARPSTCATACAPTSTTPPARQLQDPRAGAPHRRPGIHRHRVRAGSAHPRVQPDQEAPAPASTSASRTTRTTSTSRSTLRAEWPRVFTTRRVVKDGARYFGPYASARSMRSTLEVLKRIFPYRTCDMEITGKERRACLDYHIHRCLGPCIGAATREEYAQVVQQVILFLEGKSDEVAEWVRAAHGAGRRGAALRARRRATRPAPGHSPGGRAAEGAEHHHRRPGRDRLRPRRRRGLRPGLLHPRRQAHRPRALRAAGHPGQQRPRGDGQLPAAVLRQRPVRARRDPAAERDRGDAHPPVVAEAEAGQRP